MSTALAVAFTQDQIDLIRKQVAPAGTTNDELALFMSYAERTGLDPFSRQIYLSERRANVNGQWVVSRKPEVTIDGFRLVAERTGKYAGQRGPEWCGKDGSWRDVWLDDGPPMAARIGVLRHDFAEPVWSVALLREYQQTNKEGQPNSMWKKYPSVMLAKCAESLALRRAFPRELSGLYTREEMPEDRDDARQAQADVAQARIKQLSAPVDSVDIPPSVVVELAESLDAGAVSEPPPPAPKARASKAPLVSFQMLEGFADMKKQMHAETGADALYYSVLEQAGYKKSSELPNRAEGEKVYNMLKAARISIRTNKANREEASGLRAIMGEDKFWTFAGSEGVDAAVWANLTGDELAAFLAKLREVA